MIDKRVDPLIGNYKKLDYLCQTFKEEIDIIFENEEFEKIHKLDKYIELKKKYYKDDL